MNINHNISRRLTPTSVYKLQGMVSDMRRQAKKNKKGFDIKVAAFKVANRFSISGTTVCKLVGAC